MKPRRWYSSPETNPQRTPPPVCPFPDASYWRFAARPQIEQGPIIKRHAASALGHRATRATAPAPRRIEAA